MASGIWLGVAAGWRTASIGVVLAGLTRSRRLVVLATALACGVAVAAIHAQAAAATRSADLPEGVVTVVGAAVTDPMTFGVGGGAISLFRPDAVVVGGVSRSWAGPVVALRGSVPDVAAGERLRATGRFERAIDTVRGRPVAGVFTARSIARIGPATNPVAAFANVVRRRIQTGLLEASSDGRGALVTGFLIGDVTRLPERDGEALRRAGLSHYVAVSGSNVALFLAAWWVVGGPLAMGPRRRALFGMVGLVVFVIMTRWEPSVIRAALMAGLVLLGRLIGRPISPWSALGTAVALALLADPGLAGSAGFSLSVAATAGIISGAPLWSGRRPRAAWAVLGATISAQVAVAPLLILWFGSVPLVAPVSNLLAAPLVALSTAAGAVGALLSIPGATRLAVSAAGVVLGIADLSAEMPHLGALGLVGLALAVLASVRLWWIRPIGAVVLVGLVGAAMLPRLPGAPVVSFLDVGQGDATVFRGPSGEVVLVDGGPDPLLLERYLDELGVSRIDLLVISHRHADHVTGLVGLFAAHRVGLLWHPDQLGWGEVLDQVVAEAAAAGVPALVPRVGERILLGEFTVEVFAPLRHYASPNDGSVVVEVAARGTTVLMSGDIEVFAQQDMGPHRSTVLKVPHQGAATSDLEWLAASAPEVAVISVGSNEYGHPSSEVIATLTQGGARVLRTDIDGTISVTFGP